MSAASNAFENLIMDHALGGPDYTRLGTVYVALHVGDPGEDGNANEVSGTGYARQAKTNNLTNWPAAVNGAKSNGTEIDFGVAGSNWGTVTHFSIRSTLNGDGVTLFKGALSAPKPVGNGERIYFPAGTLIITAD